MNTRTSVSFLGTMCILLMSCNNGNAEETCVTVNAAFKYFDNILFLISGDDYFKIGTDMHEIQSGKLTDLFHGAPENIEAAAITSDGSLFDTLYFFTKDHYYSYSNWFDFTYGPYRNSRWTPFFSDGLDAAGKLKENSYFFKSCEYVIYDGAYSEVSPIHELGLPCDIDAVWDQGDFLVVVKGSESWILGNQGKAKGPVPLSKEITLTSSSFCESRAKSSWAKKIEEELQHEKENNCVYIDSAINHEGTVYFFNNDSYIRVNDNGMEDKLARNYDWGGLGSGMNAAIYFEKDNKGYFFQGDEYYSYYLLSFGPFSSSNAWAPFFSDGIDAAGICHGNAYFFKGCHVANYDTQEKAISEINNVGDFGLPCDINAAYAKEDKLYLIKGDLVWVWGDTVEGPKSLSEIVTFTSWNICSDEQ